MTAADDTMNYVDSSNAAFFGGELKKNFHLCGDAIIVLGSCDIGCWTKKTPNVSQAIADATGCTVISPGGFANGYFYNLLGGPGNKPMTYKEYPDSGPYHSKTYTQILNMTKTPYNKDDVYESADDTWYVTTP